MAQETGQARGREGKTTRFSQETKGKLKVLVSAFIDATICNFKTPKTEDFDSVTVKPLIKQSLREQVHCIENWTFAHRTFLCCLQAYHWSSQGHIRSVL